VRRHAETAQEALGLAFRAWREGLGLSAADVGRRIGSSQSSVSRAELGQVGFDLLDLVRAGVNIETLLADATAIAMRDGVAWPGIRTGTPELTPSG
jgi:transcriptional regulator with XRE-family HTH domain